MVYPYFRKTIVNIPFHGQSALVMGVFGIVCSVNVNSHKCFIPPNMWGWLDQMVGVAFSNVFNTEDVNDEPGKNWVLFVAPGSGSCVYLIVTGFFEADAENIICQFPFCGRP